MNVYKRQNITFSRGKGSYLYDKQGKKYLDFVAGIAVNALGHCHPIISETINKQSEKLIHISNLYYSEEQNKLAKLLVEISDHSSVFFSNSGTEAVECGLKIAKKYKAEGSKIISFKNSFHGRSLGSLSVTAQDKYQEGFGVDTRDVIYCDFNNLESVKSIMGHDVAAIIVEPIQGEGGIIPGENEFLKGLKDLSNEYDALLIFDEIQCGIGRTGDFFAYKSFGVIPDVVCLAKGLGGGLPIGATLVNKRADILSYGDHGSTFGGNPLVASVAKEVIKKVNGPKFLESVHTSAKYLMDQLQILKKSCNHINEIRGKGLMLGIEMTTCPINIMSLALDQQLLIVAAGKNTIRLVPPLNVSEYEIDLFIEKFKETLMKVEV